MRQVGEKLLLLSGRGHAHFLQSLEVPIESKTVCYSFIQSFLMQFEAGSRSIKRILITKNSPSSAFP